MSELGPTCRHFCSRNFLMNSGKSCAIGHPIRDIVLKANGGSNFGVAFKTPCKPGPEKLASCPNYDPRTPEELAAEDAKAEASMNEFVAALPFFNAKREQMVQRGLSAAKCTCPFCGEKGAMRLNCAWNGNRHMRAKCTKCNEGFIE